MMTARLNRLGEVMRAIQTGTTINANMQSSSSTARMLPMRTRISGVGMNPDRMNAMMMDASSTRSERPRTRAPILQSAAANKRNRTA